MGILTWLVAGAAALLIARRLRIGRRRSLPAESFPAVLAAVAFGLAATALDFGGWAEADWRAALFAFLGSLGAIGAVRIGRHTPSR